MSPRFSISLFLLQHKPLHHAMQLYMCSDLKQSSPLCHSRAWRLRHDLGPFPPAVSPARKAASADHFLLNSSYIKIAIQKYYSTPL